MAKRLIISVPLAFALVALAQAVFNHLPVSIFPCTKIYVTGAAADAICSLPDVNGSPRHFIASLTPAGRFTRLLATVVIPAGLGFYLEYRTRPRGRPN